MKPIERMTNIQAGRPADRTPWVPSVYEHGAALLGRSPTEVSRDAGLMAQAALKAFETYRHDIVTVGIDIYNIEAEAFGCGLASHEDDNSIPGVLTHPLAGDEPDIASLAIPQPGPGNRLGVIAKAVEQVVNRIGDQVWVYACMGGPWSQAVELRGFEDLIADLYTDKSRVHALMDKTAELAIQHADRLCRLGAGVYLYESWATMPLIDPKIFEEFVVPYNRRVTQHVRATFDVPPPAIIMGGNITLLMDYFVQAGTGLIACDYNADFDFVRSRTAGRSIVVRGCVDPKAIERGAWESLEMAIGKLAAKSQGMVNFVWGCGCVSFKTPVESVLKFRDLCAAAAR
jgi:uroporphyrinogen decarboxylase